MTTYTTWYDMVRRCTVPICKDFPYYGGRGITVCDRWLTYENFREDMGRKPSSMTLDRIDNNLGYFKDNCRWTNRRTQNLNQGPRSNNTSGIKGVSFCKTHNIWKARSFILGKETTIYQGKDFFEACCARKSYEASLKSGQGRHLP